MTINWLSLNVQGMNSPQKRVKMFKYLKQQKIDIACLQETHFASSSYPKYFASDYPHVFLSNAPTKQRGVMIALHKSVTFTCSKQISDPNGRYLILQGTIQDTWLIMPRIKIWDLFWPMSAPCWVSPTRHSAFGGRLQCGIEPFLRKLPLRSQNPCPRS